MPSSTSAKTCCNETLAAGPMAHIQRCRDCGTVAIHLGATTVRLAPEACESLWATLTEALTELHRREVEDLGQGPWPSVTAREMS
jgi:hypothetical protein